MILKRRLRFKEQLICQAWSLMVVLQRIQPLQLQWNFLLPECSHPLQGNEYSIKSKGQKTCVLFIPATNCMALHGSHDFYKDQFSRVKMGMRIFT